MLAHSRPLFLLNVVLRACAGRIRKVCSVSPIQAGGTPPQTHLQDGQVQIVSGKNELHHFTVRTTRKKILRGKQSPGPGGRFPKLHSFHICKGPLIVFVSFMFTDTVNVLCNKLLWQTHGNVLQHSCKFDFFPSPAAPSPLTRRSTFIQVSSRGGGRPKKPSSVSLSTHLVKRVAVTVANTTWKSVPCICFHSKLAPCFGQSLRSLLQLYEKSLSSYSMVNTLPYAAWRISNWEHMVQCSSPFFVVCFTCAD